MGKARVFSEAGSLSIVFDAVQLIPLPGFKHPSTEENKYRSCLNSMGGRLIDGVFPPSMEGV
jgi:hypothetical protein